MEGGHAVGARTPFGGSTTGATRMARQNLRAKIFEVVQDDGDETAQPGSYQHSLGMRRRWERKAQMMGLKLRWKNPVREGITKGLFDLHDGGTVQDVILIASE